MTTYIPSITRWVGTHYPTQKKKITNHKEKRIALTKQNKFSIGQRAPHTWSSKWASKNKICNLHFLLWLITICINSISSICALWVVLGSTPFSLYNNVPCDCFQQGCSCTQKYENADVSILPFLFGDQHVKAPKYVDNAEDDDSVSSGVMVDVPE